MHADLCDGEKSRPAETQSLLPHASSVANNSYMKTQGAGGLASSTPVVEDNQNDCLQPALRASEAQAGQ